MAGLGFRAQAAAVMEVFANAALLEICALAERSLARLQEETLRAHNENHALRRKLRLLEVREAFYKRANRLKNPDWKSSGRMVRVKIRSVENQSSGEGVDTHRPPASTQEQALLESVAIGDSDVLIVKKENVDCGRRSDTAQSPEEEQERPFRVPEDTGNFLERNTVQIHQQECVEGGAHFLNEEETREFLKEENLEQHVGEDCRDKPGATGNSPKDRGSEAEPEADLHSAASASWDSSGFNAGSHSLSYPGPDCGVGTSVSEFYIHGGTGETLCHFGPPNTLPDMDAHSAHDELGGADRTLSQLEAPPFKPGFSPQMMKERFLCKYCGKLFSNTSALILHQRVHTGEKPYYCTLCGKRFSQSSSLKKHHSIHLGEKPFRCIHCGKQFSDQSNLRKHVNVHTGEKPYGCSQCGKTFNQSSNLKTHMKIHTREKPFGCERCGQIFAYKNSLVKHQQKNCLVPQSSAGQFYTPDH